MGMRLFQHGRITKTLNAVSEHLKKQPAIGTTPGKLGWPKLSREDVEAIMAMKTDREWVILPIFFGGSKYAGAVVYGLNAQAAWTEHMKGVKALVKVGILEQDHANQVNAAIKAMIEKELGIVIREDP